MAKKNKQKPVSIPAKKTLEDYMSRMVERMKNRG